MHSFAINMLSLILILINQHWSPRSSGNQMLDFDPRRPVSYLLSSVMKKLTLVQDFLLTYRFHIAYCHPVNAPELSVAAPKPVDMPDQAVHYQNFDTD
jgi:hypothetical protein